MGNQVFEMENAAGVAELVVLAELAPPISPADGLSISTALFTTIENLAPEVKQGFGADAFSFALGLYVPHLLIGEAPCEELLASVHCLRALRDEFERARAADRRCAAQPPRRRALAASQWQGPCARARARLCARRRRRVTVRRARGLH